MGSAIVDGFERGFNMMERHNSRVGRDQRLSRLEKQNEERYQDSQARLSDLDKKNEDRYNASQLRLSDLDKKDDARYQDTVKYREDTQKATEEFRGWQQQQQEKNSAWAQDQQLIGVGWDYFRENGQVSPEHEEMFQRNKGYDPRTFQNPEMRQQVKALNSNLGDAVKSGDLSKINSPENVTLFNSVFKDKFSSSIGTVDPLSGKKIRDVDFAGFVPTEDEDFTVSFALKVTYEDGTTIVKPKTQGGTTEQGDPVLKLKPQEIIGAVQAKMMMADMIERPDYWDKMGASIGGSLSKQRGSSKGGQDAEAAQYQKERSKLSTELRKAQMDAAKEYMDGEQLTAYLKPITDAINALDAQFGHKNTPPPDESDVLGLFGDNGANPLDVAIPLDNSQAPNQQQAAQPTAEPQAPEPQFTDQENWWLSPDIPTEAAEQMSTEQWSERISHLKDQRVEKQANSEKARSMALGEMRNVFPKLNRNEKTEWFKRNAQHLTNDERKELEYN